MIQCLLAAFLLLPVQASAQELWRGVRAGDSPAQVQALFPDARRSDEPTALPGRTEWHVVGVSLNGHNSEVTFAFDDDALLSVILSFEAADKAAADAIHADLTAGMSAEHGQPEACENDTVRRRCQWRVNGVEIGVSRWQLGDHPGFVNMWHKAAAPRPATGMPR